MLLSEEVGQIVVHADLLDQSNHVVPGACEDLFVGECAIGCEDDVAKAVVLSQEEDLQGG
jgi:hypothetical protein